MEDFLTHLAERTLGVAPVVQPIIASTFGSEPSNHLPGLERDGETPTLSGDLDQPRASWSREDEPVGDAGVAQREDRSDVAATAPKLPQKGSDTAKPHPRAESSTGGAGAATNPPRRVVPEDSASAGPLSLEGLSGRTTSRPVSNLVERARGGTGPVSHPPSDTQEGTVGPEAGPRASWPQEDEPVGDAGVAQREDRSDVAATAPKLLQRTSDTAMPDFARPGVPFRHGDQQNLPSAAPGSLQRTPGSRARRSPLSESGSSEHRDVSEKKDQRDSSHQATPRHPPVPPQSRPATPHHAGPSPTRRAALSASQSVVPENLPLGQSSTANESGEAVFGPIERLVEGEQGAIEPPRPSPGVRASLLDASEDTLNSKATLNRSAPRDTPSLVAPEIVRHQPNRYLEQGPREPRVAAPEMNVPTVRVNVGRIEVRAVTPPPPMPPAQQTAPARPRPTLTLDDYLKQRNGG